MISKQEVKIYNYQNVNLNILNLIASYVYAMVIIIVICGLEILVKNGYFS